MYNENKFCFIICANMESFLEECLLYLRLLEIPDGFETEILTIREAPSMAAGYNEGMRASDARYKIYLHQDTFITEKKFLQKLLDIFSQDQTIGMVGMIGSPTLSKDGVMWHGNRCGDFYRLEELQKSGVQDIEKLTAGIKEVEAADGLLLATREDIAWREDILKEWDFYDVSQCLEFRRAGYRVVVPAQNPSWTVHACGIPSFWNYNENREIILKNYPEITADKDKLRIVFFHSNMITLLGLPMGLMQLGHSVSIPECKVSLNTCVESELEPIRECLEEGHYDLAVTYDFSRCLSAVCQEFGVKYLAWVYDSPLLELYTKEAFSPNNHICVFDHLQFGRLKDEIPHLYHFPLAAEVDYFGSIGIQKKDEKKYDADVAFVGRLYSKRGYEAIMDGAGEALTAEANKIVRKAACVWDKESSIFGAASEELITYMTSQENKAVFEDYRIDKRYYFESMYLARKANEIERTAILNKLAERFRVVLYTDKKELDENCLKKVTIRPWVDYWAEMPRVFHISRINLNITSRSIESGIPQRVFDVLAVGGFLLTNYQPELEEWFQAGVDLEVYHDTEELLYKVDYYLKHEKERIRIAMNGYRKMRECHSYEKRMEEVLKKVMGGESAGKRR